MTSTSTSASSTKKAIPPKKTFTFKKRSPCVKLDEEDDDDDFKPCKSRQAPVPVQKQVSKESSGGPAVKNGRTLSESETKGGGRSVGQDKKENRDSDSIHSDGERRKFGTSSPVDHGDGDVSRESDQENADEITFLFKTNIVSLTDDADDVGRKTAWKDLMGQMQKNQKDVKQSSRGNKASKRGMGLRSPASRKGDSAEVRSPLKKNPRLGASKQSNDQTTGATGVCVKGLELPGASHFHDNVIVDESKSKAVEKNIETEKPKKSTKIAPIFLPPAERKALSKANSVPLSFTDSELVKSFVSIDTPSVQHVENPNHFKGNVVLLNLDQPDKDPYGGNKTKICPFYKKMPGVPFCVDAFNYGLIPEMEVYFLSHFHSDHYIGLNKKFCKTLICSYPTGNLVRMKLYVEEKCIRKLELDKPYVICNAEVTLVDANHCPGSVMFIFRLKSGEVILHTGDFRYTSCMLRNPFLSNLKVDTVYLDTTYCSPEYDFPTQIDSISSLVVQIKKHLEYRPKTLILCGSYVIGKERVCFTVAEAIGSQVFANHDKRKVINALENPKFSSMLTADEKAAVHVVPMFSISAQNLKECLDKQGEYSNIIGVKPSGWQFSSSGSGCSIKTHYGGAVTIIGIPYSEHSSYSELKEFVSSVKAKKIQPTVNVGNPKKRSDMMKHIDNWLSL